MGSVTSARSFTTKSAPATRSSSGCPVRSTPYNETEPSAPTRCDAGQCVLDHDGPVRCYLEAAGRLKEYRGVRLAGRHGCGIGHHTVEIEDDGVVLRWRDHQGSHRHPFK
jgi:hypothetical protein